MTQTLRLERRAGRRGFRETHTPDARTRTRTATLSASNSPDGFEPLADMPAVAQPPPLDRVDEVHRHHEHERERQDELVPHRGVPRVEQRWPVGRRVRTGIRRLPAVSPE